MSPGLYNLPSSPGEFPEAVHSNEATPDEKNHDFADAVRLLGCRMRDR